MANLLTKDELQQTLEIIQQIYLSDNIPWICGYSGGKDSSAVVQLVWMALQQLPVKANNPKVKEHHQTHSKPLTLSQLSLKLPLHLALRYPMAPST